MKKDLGKKFEKEFKRGMKERGFPHRSRRFPTFAVIVLVIAVIWLLNDLKLLAIDIPWIPVVLIIIAMGWIVNSYERR